MSSARNHQKRSHRSYRVTKSICGSVARKAWVTPQHSPKQSGLLALIRRLIRGRAQRTADRKRRERVPRADGGAAAQAAEPVPAMRRRALPGALRVRDDGRRRDGRVHEALPLSLYAGASRAAVLRKFSTEPLTCRPFSLPAHEPVAGCFLLHNI